MMGINDPLHRAVNEELNHGLVMLDGFEAAFLGYTRPPIGRGHERQEIAVYDYDRMRDLLITRDGMCVDEAETFINDKVRAVWLGPLTPLLIQRVTVQNDVA